MITTETIIWFGAGFCTLMAVLALREWRGAVRERRRLDGLHKRPAAGISVNGQQEWDYDDQDHDRGHSGNYFN